jgi:L,D-peptidoglycan transpeptidase YkuD (ErfK/YbiS/YcfS/YnhG family)
MLKFLYVTALGRPQPRHAARLHAGPLVFQASVGRSGISWQKREGDGFTPAGTFLLGQGFFRSDRLKRPAWNKPLSPMRPKLGWCDDPRSQLYNRPVKSGSRDRHENLWRDDGVYDIVFTTNHNERPRILNGGSAIFFHLSKAEYRATQGCVAVCINDMRKILGLIGKRTKIVIRR